MSPIREPQRRRSRARRARHLAARSCSNWARSSPCVVHRRTRGRSGCRRCGSRPRSRRCTGGTRPVAAVVARAAARIAGSSRLSTGLPSSTQSSSASRSAGTPGRPRRACRSDRRRSAAGEASPVVTTWPTARTPRRRRARRVAQRAQDVRGADRSSRSTGVRSVRSRGRWTTAPATVAPASAAGSSTSIGSPPGAGCPTDAAERCDAIAPVPAARTAARIACEGVGAAADHSGHARGGRGSSSPCSMARYHAALGVARRRSRRGG